MRTCFKPRGCLCHCCHVEALLREVSSHASIHLLQLNNSLCSCFTRAPSDGVGWHFCVLARAVAVRLLLLLLLLLLALSV
jgi:hypothetical protein